MDHPVEWLKAIYESFGTPYPRLSLCVVGILGAAVAIGIWSFAAKQVQKDHHTSSVPPQVSGQASTTGNDSPAVTGSGNDIKYEQAPPEKKPAPAKKE